MRCTSLGLSFFWHILWSSINLNTPKKHLKYNNEACKINTLIIVCSKFLAMSPTCQPSHYNLKEFTHYFSSNHQIFAIFISISNGKKILFTLLVCAMGVRDYFRTTSSIGLLSFVVKCFLNIFLQTFIE